MKKKLLFLLPLVCLLLPAAGVILRGILPEKTRFIRVSEAVSENSSRPQAASNPHSTLSVPSCVTRIGDDYFIRWRDTHVRITGNAVSALQYSFLFSYICSGGVIESGFSGLFPPEEKAPGKDKLIQIVPDQPDDMWPIIHMGAVWTIQHSTRYVYIQTPYFVPPEPLMQALKAAALKGTDVRIMLPQVSDSSYMDPANKSHYQECLDAGIRIYEKTGSFIHSKTIVSDDYLSIVGSANMDFRSLELNYEINAYIYGEETARENKEIFMKDLESCREILPEQWKRRPWYRKVLETILRLFAPLL